MKKLVVVFDLDYTLFNSHVTDGIKWIGSQDFWLNLCKLLDNLGDLYGVQVRFAIASNKGKIDDHVYEAVSALQQYLFVRQCSTGEFYNTRVEEGTFHINNQGQSVISTKNEDVVSEKHFLSSIQIQKDTKTTLLENIALVYGVSKEDYASIFLLDDKPNICEEVSAVGFSAIFAEDLCKKRALNTDNFRRFTHTVLYEIGAKIKQLSSTSREQHQHGFFSNTITVSQRRITSSFLSKSVSPHIQFSLLKVSDDLRESFSALTPACEETHYSR